MVYYFFEHVLLSQILFIKCKDKITESPDPKCSKTTAAICGMDFLRNPSNATIINAMSINVKANVDNAMPISHN
jgi:hypothetical protein